MRHEVFTVKLCASCPYTPEDLEDGLYDPESEFFCCGQCPDAKIIRHSETPFIGEGAV